MCLYVCACCVLFKQYPFLPPEIR
uniref:Uncharacterized protein n=1 Tax=Arundo donax TaxID=35708 RepID=A0A0A9GYT4_ARUDO